MTIPTYNLGFPKDGSSLGSSKAPIRDNLDGTFETVAIDHINNNGVSSNRTGIFPAGYHDIIHQITQIALPSLVSNAIQLFSLAPVNSIPGTRAQFHVMLNNGKLSQMTGNSPTANGNMWCAGMLVQWGVVNGTHGSDNHFTSGDPITVSFNADPNNFNFPNACLSVWTQIFNLSTNLPGGKFPAVISIQSNTLTSAGFSGTFQGDSSSYTSFMWIALGF